MKKESLFLILSLFLSINNVLATEELLVKGTKTQVSKQQFLSALQRMDEHTRFNFLNKERRVFKAVKNYYLTKVAINKSKISGLYDTPKMQALIEKAIGDTVIKEMYQIYLEKELAKKKFVGFARDYYKANKDTYKLPPEIDASHILIDHKTRSKEEAKALAEKIRQQLLEGKDFVALATEYSNDPTVLKNKGRLGFFSRKKMVKPFSEVAFSLKSVGEISSVIETNFGYHIIRLEAKKEKSIIPFEQIKDNLITDLKKKETVKINEHFKTELIDEKNIEINRKAIMSLVTQRKKQ